ncbi:unnamed protein product [Ixodes pacificus]
MIASNGMGDSACARVETVSFRVAGFLDILDWRPVLFQEPIIAQRACALCGVVYKKAVRLSCVHTLCLKCHAKCVDEGSVCPVDQEPFCKEDIEKLEVSVEYILKRKVACWNAPRGCCFIGSAASLLDHYKECHFSVVSCCLCHSSVSQGDILEHFKSGCSIHEATFEPAHNPTTQDLKEVTRACLEMKKAMGRIGEDIMSLKTSLNRCCEDIRATDVSCIQLLEDQASRISDLNALCAAGFTEEQRALEKAVADMSVVVTNDGNRNRELMSQELCAHSDRLNTGTEKVSTTVISNRELLIKKLHAESHRLIACTKGLSGEFVHFCGQRAYHWYTSDWAHMKATAMKGGSADTISPAWYAFGYRVGLDLELRKNENGELHLACFFTIHPGSYDSDLGWPFSKSLEFKIVHPKCRSMDISHEINADLYREEPAFQRPRGTRTRGFGAASLCSADKLDTGGFLRGNTLHVFLEVKS